MLNTFKEYIKLVPKFFDNPQGIIEGIMNSIKMDYGNLPEHDQKTILERRLICQSCPFNSVNAQTSKEYKELHGEYYTTNRPDLHCSFCACPIKTKTAALNENCGIEYYNKINNKDIELKWTKK